MSLVPSVTETLLAWGVTPVAVTRFCEHDELPSVGGTKDPDVGAIVRLAPDVVVVNDEENRREDAAALERAGLDVHVVHIEGLVDVAPALAALAAALGLAPPELPPLAVPYPLGVRAFVPIWRRPWMTLNARTYGSSLLAALGVTNVFADAGQRYPEVTLDEAVAARPDVVLAPSEPYPFTTRQEEELAVIAPVLFVDGKDLFWWGTRTPDAVRRLAHSLSSSSGRAPQ